MTSFTTLPSWKVVSCVRKYSILCRILYTGVHKSSARHAGKGTIDLICDPYSCTSCHVSHAWQEAWLWDCMSDLITSYWQCRRSLGSWSLAPPALGSSKLLCLGLGWSGIPAGEVHYTLLPLRAVSWLGFQLWGCMVHLCGWQPISADVTPSHGSSWWTPAVERPDQLLAPHFGTCLVSHCV